LKLSARGGRVKENRLGPDLVIEVLSPQDRPGETSLS
jgi:Uma2 family endonuclease